MHATSILIVDDDATSRIVLERMLQSFGHGVRTADSGEAALESFKAALPDVVLLDIQMPGIVGYETAKRMKVIAGEQHVPILMLTGLTDDGVLEKALQAGADDYLSKPYKRGPLAARVEAALRSRSLFSRLDRQHARLLELTEQSEREQRLAQALPYWMKARQSGHQEGSEAPRWRAYARG